MKKKRLFLLLLVSFFVIIFIGCNNKLVVNGVKIEKYQIHTELQDKFLEGDYNLISSIATGSEELSYPLPVVLKLNKLSEYKENNLYQILLSNDYSFADSKIYTTKENELEVYNLKINIVYYWKVISSNNESKIFGFMIESVGPRNIYIDGITNARDLGGWNCSDGKVVKQGMIFRTSKFNEDESTNILITEKGIKMLVEELKIKSELDVRDIDDNENGGITNSPLGDEINYFPVTMKSGGNYLTLNKGRLKDVFAVLGNESNYPIVIHCSIGTDRTGVICFLVNGLLGVSEEDLYKDYLFSNFANTYGVRTTSAIKDYLKQINYASGDTLEEKFYNYLVNNGVNEEDLKTIIRIMKEDKIQY